MNAQTKIEPATLHAAMAAAFAEIESATKSANNPHFKSKYADLTTVIEAIKPALAKHNLFFTQRPTPCERGIQIETVISHASGEDMSLGILFVPANKNDAQGYGSALTYARRYALVTAFGVPVEDDDGNAATTSQRAEQKADEGQSQQGAVSPPANTRAPAWETPIKNKSNLHKALTALERELAGCGDSDMVYALTATKDWKDFVATAEVHAPHYLRGGEPAPQEFEGLQNTAERMVREFDSAQANNMAALART